MSNSVSLRRSFSRLSGAAVLAATAVACSSPAPTAPLTAVTAAPSSTVSVQGTMRTPYALTSSPTPILIDGGPGSNYSCSQLATLYGGSGAEWLPGKDSLKLDNAPSAGSYTLTDGYVTVQITSGTMTSFNWSSNIAIDAVFVKSGQGHNLYVYSGESTGDSGLSTPFLNNKYQDISHISFCYDVELAVTKTAPTTFTRDYDWAIAKSVDQTSVAVVDNGTATVNYSVAVTRDDGTDSDWKVSGTITVGNPHNTLTAGTVSVVDDLSDFGAVAVSCPATSLAPGATMTCSYGPVALPNGGSRTNKATADSGTYGIVAGSGTASVDFITPTTVLDPSVSVTDTMAGMLASALTSGQTFTYARTINGANYACDSTNTIDNTASLATDDSQTRSASASLTVTKTCAPPPPPPPPPPASSGCTLTQGYWGTHSSKGPAKYDATWALIGENTPFYQSGTSYYGVLQLPTKGNAYYILAHQFIAAKLNVLKGAPAPAGVNMTAIETFFSTYTPSQIGALKGANAVRAQALAWAATLDSYNNGLLNAPHCD